MFYKVFLFILLKKNNNNENNIRSIKVDYKNNVELTNLYYNIKVIVIINNI